MLLSPPPYTPSSLCTVSHSLAALEHLLLLPSSKNSFFQIFFPFYLPNYLRVSIVELQSHYTLHPVQLATHAFGIEYASMPWNLMDLNHE